MAKRLNNPPYYRSLQGYAFDPSLSLVIDTIDINQIIYKVIWEDDLGPGPVGEYIEVIDYDPSLGLLYEPVELNDPYILATNGLPPSEGNPQFHQQMAYAVAMTTIRNFELSLGRKILWAPRLVEGKEFENYVQRLRIYPHALREANAYYSPMKKAILCGYFSASPVDKTHLMPGSIVFTCLSHDIIAHEVTHAILDGLHRHYDHPSNPDVLAFHEAFADIVALFQHFSFPEVLKHQVAKTRGSLDSQNLLAQLAQQFGSAIGMYGSLRDALGENDPGTGAWKPKTPNTIDYQKEMEPHKRGGILVAAVFDAFLTIYKDRVSDLFRIATGGSGVLPQGALHPDLVNRLAQEAAKSARHILRMCVRAIDYCPPVDITFGDFLRAVITADIDTTSEDNRNYRLAFIDAFRRRGIYPENMTSLSEESLRYTLNFESLEFDTREMMKLITEDLLRPYRNKVMYEKDRKEIFKISKDFIAGNYSHDVSVSEDTFNQGLHQKLWGKFDNSFEFEKLTGLVFNTQWKDYGVKANDNEQISYQILNLRLLSRVGPEETQVNQIIFNMVQSIGVIVTEDGQIKTYNPQAGKPAPPGGFEVRGGCTLIFDLDELELRHAISKPLLNPIALNKKRHELNKEWIQKQHRYITGTLPLHLSDPSRYFEDGFKTGLNEPFALLHQH